MNSVRDPLKLSPQPQNAKKKKKKRGTQTRPFSSVPKRVLNFLSRGMSRLILKWKKNRLENRELVKCVTNCCKFLLVTSMYMPHLMPVTIYKQILLVNYFNCKVRLVTLFSCINYFINLWILLIENTLEIFLMEKKKTDY